MTIISSLFFLSIKNLILKILFCLFLFSNLFCQCLEEKTQRIFHNIYSKMHLLPTGNRLIIDNNKTCIYHYKISNSLKKYFGNENKYFCLYEKALYLLVNQAEYKEILNIGFIHEGTYYDFNIHHSSGHIDCIISFVNSEQIKFHHYTIFLDINNNFFSDHNENSFNAKNSLSDGLSCHINIEHNSLVCFYSYISSDLYTSSFNITNNFKSK